MDRPPANIQLEFAVREQSPTLANLLELYAHDFSEFHDLEIGEGCAAVGDEISRAAERNVEQRNSYRRRDQNQAGNDENRLSCRRTRSQADCAFDHREREVTVNGSAVSKFLITVLR